MIFSRYLCATLRTPSSESRPNAMTSSSTPSPDFLQQRVPHYLLTWPHQRRMVLFAVIVALVFINLTRPYALPERMGTSDFMYLVWSTVLVSFGAVILTVSRIIMTFYVRRSGITNAEYGSWMVVELLVMSVIFAVCFYCIGAEEDFMHALLSSLWKNALFLISPYVICTFYYSLQDKKQKLASLESDLDRATMQKAVTRGLLTFLDERGELQLSVAKESFLYVAAADNYVAIWYLKNNQPRKQTIRTTMTRLAEQLEGTAVMRCHRSYFVNLELVKVLRRGKDGGFVLELGVPGVPDIPVSKTYSEAVTKWLEM